MAGRVGLNTLTLTGDSPGDALREQVGSWLKVSGGGSSWHYLQARAAHDYGYFLWWFDGRDEAKIEVSVESEGVERARALSEASREKVRGYKWPDRVAPLRFVAVKSLIANLFLLRLVDGSLARLRPPAGSPPSP